MERSVYAERAGKLFEEGYNCSQAVVLAFSDLYDIDSDTAAKLASSFGGGLGRLREVCGAVSGMAIVAGILKGYSSPRDYEKKAAHYKLIQELAEKFREEQGAIICRELLGLDNGKEDYHPEKRTEQYYKKRPCKEIVMCAAAIVEEKLL